MSANAGCEVDAASLQVCSYNDADALATNHRVAGGIMYDIHDMAESGEADTEAATMTDSDGFAAAGDFKTPSLDELLRISIILSDKEKLHESALQDSPAMEMPEEDKRWLLEAMAVGAGKSDASRMEDSLAVLADASEPLTHKEYSLDLLLFLVEDIDNANNFVKLDGALPSLVKLLPSAHPTLRLGAAWVLGAAMQNNPKAQAVVHAAGCLPALLGLARDDGVVDVRRKALLAVSALVRGFDAGHAAFTKAGGFTLLASLAGAKADAQLRKRALFLAAHLLSEAPALGAAAADAGLLKAAAGQLTAADAEARELALSVLQAAVEGDPAAADGLAIAPQVRKTPRWPRLWANFSPL